MLIDNGTIMEENIKTPHDALDAISTTIKAKEHFWAHRDELLPDIRQQPNGCIHALSQHIYNLITKCKLPHVQAQEMLKIMLLQHAVCFHEAREWICQQDQSKLTYQSLLSHCKLLESRCEQYHKARERGRADLMSISAATASASSVHTNALTTQAHCNKCSYMHPPNKCPAGDPSSTATVHNKVKTTPGEIQAETEADAPAGLLAGSHTATTAKAIAPPIALAIATAVAHCPTSLTNPITGKHPIGTTRTLLTSYSPTALKLWTNSPEVTCLWREHQMARSPSSPNSTSYPRWNKADHIQDRS